MPTEPFKALARNNAWSNHRLLTAAAALSEAEFKAARTSFFPSLFETLNHILEVDLYYIDALTAGGRGEAIFSDYTPADTAGALRPRQWESDLRLVTYCDGLSEGDLAADVMTDRGERGIVAERREALLLHLFMHQTHHRGQAHAMLSGTQVPPPQLDEFFLAFDADLRRHEIAELGLGRS